MHTGTQAKSGCGAFLDRAEPTLLAQHSSRLYQAKDTSVTVGAQAMADQTARQIESMSTRVFVLERLLAAILDTLVTRGRISHSDVALALEQLEADLQIRGAGNKLVVEGLPTNEIKKQLSMFRHSLGLDL